MNLIPISSIDDPRVADYANVRDAQLLQIADPADTTGASRGVFIAEGELVFRQLVASRYRTLSVFTTPPRLRTIQDALAKLPPETPVYLAEPPVMSGIVGFHIHRGLLAVGARGRLPTLDELIAPRPRLLLVLEDLANHDNLGGIFRNGAALGAGGVLLSPRCADPLYRKALRVSIGHALTLPFARAESWPDAPMARLREAGYLTAALTPSPDAIDIAELARRTGAEPRPVALLLGAEGPGLTRGAMGAAQTRVRIPIAPSVDSLNVATAAAIALHRLWKPQEDGT